MTQVVEKLIVSDVVLAAVLRYKSYGIQEIVPGPTKAAFVFHNVDRDLLTALNCDQLMVEPKVFAAHLRQLVRTAKQAIKIEQGGGVVND